MTELGLHREWGESMWTHQAEFRQAVTERLIEKMQAFVQIAYTLTHSGPQIEEEWKVVDKWWSADPVEILYRSWDNGLVEFSRDGGESWDEYEGPR